MAPVDQHLPRSGRAAPLTLASYGTPSDVPLFEHLESIVISLARGERRVSAGGRGKVRILLGRLVALPPSNPLADERLEALRQIVVVARRCGRAAAERRLPQFLARGFTPLQGAAILQEARRP